MLDFLKNKNSSEFKIRNAINDEPLGPYNQELFDLSRLTYNHKALSVITSTLQKTLTKAMAGADHPKRSYSEHFRGPQGHERRGLHRASSLHATAASPASYRKDLVVLKCLTVIVHLCQNGSGQFLDWARANYDAVVAPLARLSFHPKTANAIYSKIDTLLRYREHEEVVHARCSMDQMRSEMVPGIHRGDRSPSSFSMSPASGSPTSPRFPDFAKSPFSSSTTPAVSPSDNLGHWKSL